MTKNCQSAVIDVEAQNVSRSQDIALQTDGPLATGSFVLPPIQPISLDPKDFDHQVKGLASSAIKEIPEIGEGKIELNITIGLLPIVQCQLRAKK